MLFCHLRWQLSSGMFVCRFQGRTARCGAPQVLHRHQPQTGSMVRLSLYFIITCWHLLATVWIISEVCRAEMRSTPDLGRPSLAEPAVASMTHQAWPCSASCAGSSRGHGAILLQYSPFSSIFMESVFVQWSAQVPVYVLRAGGRSGGDAKRHVDQSTSQWCIVSSTP